MIEVVVVEATAIGRSGLAALLAADGDIAVVATAADPDQAVEVVEAHTPDVVVTELELSGGGGDELTRRLVERPAGVPTVVVTARPSDANLQRALGAGAKGLVVKDSEPDLLRVAVRTVAEGLTFIDPHIAEAVVILAHKGRRTRGPYGLTVQERRVLRLLRRGLSNQEIAEELGVAVETVKTHLRRSLPKLGARDRADAARIAEEEDLG